MNSLPIFITKIHPSLETLVHHACRFAEDALLNKTQVPPCLMFQNHVVLTQAACTLEMDIYKRSHTLFELTKLARHLGLQSETVAVLTIDYKDRAVVGRKGSRPVENEVVFLNAESRAGECSLSFEVLREAAGTSMGLREIKIPPSITCYFPEGGSPHGSLFGLLGNSGQPRAEILSQTKCESRSKKSKGDPKGFELRTFPLSSPAG